MAEKTAKADTAEKTEKKPKKAPAEKAERKGGDKRGASSRSEEKAKVVVSSEAVAPRFAEKYGTVVVPALTKQFSYTNPNQVPRLQKIVINMGLGAAVTNPKIVDAAVEELRAITGQKPVVTRAKKAIASFKLRAGIPIGAMVTLRKGRMWEFLDRLVTLALPRTRDFRGVSRKAFDGKGNYTLGLTRADHLPGDQLRPHRRDQGAQHQLRDHRAHRRRGARPPATSRDALPRGLRPALHSASTKHRNF